MMTTPSGSYYRAQSINDWKSTGKISPLAFAETDNRMAQAQQMLATPAIAPSSGQQAQQPLAPKSANVRPPVSASSEPTKGGAKRAQEADDTKSQEPKKRKLNTSAKKTDKKSPEALLDVSGITLPGEEEAGRKVPVYETCDSMRRKIRLLLKKPGMTQAAFCRALGKFGDVDDAPPPRQLARFLGKKGPLKGNVNAVYYPSYVLFEKMRIRDGKDKSKFRKEVEEKHASRGGIDVEKSWDGPFILHDSQSAHIDRWGVFEISRRYPRK